MADANWLEASLSVNGELAEAVAEVFDRFVSNGVVIESNVKHLNADDMGTEEATVRVAGYLFMDDHVEEKRRRLEEALWHLSQIQALPTVQFRTIEDEDWMAAWKKHYHPILVGKRLQIVPAWIKVPKTERISIRINPSMAFGTGTHPSTQLCLEHLENLELTGKTVIDIGCGSGILSIAAVKLGAQYALGVDIDPAAVKNTQENADLNKVGRSLEVGLGSVKEILAGAFAIQSAPIVVVNILAPVIKTFLQEGLLKVVTPQGLLILAGILEEQLDDVMGKASKQGFRLMELRKTEDWVSPLFTRI